MLTEFFERITDLIESAVHLFGVTGIGFIALIENLFPPTPSEFMYPLAGKLAFDGRFTLGWVIMAGVIGSMVGSTIYYLIGYHLGESRIRHFIKRYGRLSIGNMSLRLLSAEDYDRALNLLRNRGGIIVIVARTMPLIHSAISIPAGVSRMRFLPFLAYTAIGAAIWISTLTLLGYWLGSQWYTILDWVEVYETGIYILVICAVIFVVGRRWRKRSQNRESMSVQ